MITDQPCPMPLDWHPFYAEMPWLADWLNGTGQFADQPIQFQQPGQAPVETGPTLTKRKCWGAAPYVGRPFCYVWPAAIDDSGRAIAGEAKLQYTMSEGEWFIYGGAE